MACDTCPTSGFHDLNIWLEIKPHAPLLPNYEKQVYLTDGSNCPLVIAYGNPWCATFTLIRPDTDDLDENYDPPFLHDDWIIDAINAAKRARFEFGEKPEYTGQLFERMIA